MSYTKKHIKLYFIRLRWSSTNNEIVGICGNAGVKRQRHPETNVADTPAESGGGQLRPQTCARSVPGQTPLRRPERARGKKTHS